MFLKQTTSDSAQSNVGKIFLRFNRRELGEAESSLRNWVFGRFLFVGFLVDWLISTMRRINPPAKKKKHCCHRICFHRRKRLQQEKHECWFFSVCIPDLWKQSLFSRSLTERLCTAESVCLVNQLPHAPCSISSLRRAHIKASLGFVITDAGIHLLARFQFLIFCKSLTWTIQMTSDGFLS